MPDKPATIVLEVKRTARANKRLTFGPLVALAAPAFRSDARPRAATRGGLEAAPANGHLHPDATPAGSGRPGRPRRGRA